MKKIVIAVTLAVVATVPTACRSKAKVQPKAAPVEQVAAKPAAPAPAPAPPAAPEPKPEWTTIEELNELARSRGWLNDAFFAYDSASLSAEAQEALTRSAQWLRDNRDLELLIEGHCDERGTAEYNLALGQGRASAASAFLAAQGIDPSRVRTVSYGKEKPFVVGSDEVSYSQNRRAHLRLTGRKS